MPPPRPPPVPTGFQSKSTPNLPTIRSFETTSSTTSSNTDATPPSQQKDERSSPNGAISPPEPASIEKFSIAPRREPLPSLSPATSDDEGSSEEEEDAPMPNLPPRTLYNLNHSRSNTYLTPSAFAPPFYNRPPTPLPPSPSLTSLLRPNFSSANSRPTTPDPSSDEGGTPQPATGEGGTGAQTPNSAAASTLTSTYRTAKPIPRASPRVPTYEYYGFTLYLTSSLGFIVYLLWAFLPSAFLKQWGIEDFPDRWWALALPAWTVVFILYIYVALASYNTGYLTLPLDSVECLVDEAANIAVVDAQGRIIVPERASWESAGGPPAGSKGGGGSAMKINGRGRHGGHSQRNSLSTARGSGGVETTELDWRRLWNEGTDAVMDIPVGGVCEILYGAHGEDANGEAEEEYDIQGNAHDR